MHLAADTVLGLETMCVPAWMIGGGCMLWRLLRCY